MALPLLVVGTVGLVGAAYAAYRAFTDPEPTGRERERIEERKRKDAKAFKDLSDAQRSEAEIIRDDLEAIKERLGIHD